MLLGVLACPPYSAEEGNRLSQMPKVWFKGYDKRNGRARGAMMQRSALLLIRAYQRFVSPLLSKRLRCRFYPTCSHYAFLSIEEHGTIRGIHMTIRRLRRCRQITLTLVLISLDVAYVISFPAGVSRVSRYIKTRPRVSNAQRLASPIRESKNKKRNVAQLTSDKLSLRCVTNVTVKKRDSLKP